MFPCINVCGYLGLFNVKESDVKYALNKELAKQLIASNDTFNIPLVVSHVNFRVDLTVGFLTELTIDSRGLYCKGLINNAAFLEVQNQMNDDFINFFTKATPSPFLYLKSCLPCFSLSHDKKSLTIKHVALVDLGARRGTLINYSYANQNVQPKRYASSTNDIFIALGCYSRNALKHGRERNELLFKDALLCDNHDTEFICAEKKTINAIPCEYLSTTNMDSENMTSALALISTIASALNQQKGQKRTYSGTDEEPPCKRSKLEPVVHATETLLSSTSKESNIREELNEFKQHMQKLQTDFLAAQTSMLKEVFSPVMRAPQPQYYHQPQYQSIPTQIPPTFVQQPIVPQTLPSPVMSEQKPVTPVQQETNIIPDVKRSEDKVSRDCALIEAGMQINESEHLINELFRQFIERKFYRKAK
ncbi:hypothetical protein DPMN_148016 [Dreissena polymorpha]|uniref:Uncharacterized protein n=1 Tax=Dreissena polymorpha TaxID=45954 RepID=A0A9D4F8S7_DREPO|nr:hypothetical protein DPMN_148016 [Dreissena polymorpha]